MENYAEKFIFDNLEKMQEKYAPNPSKMQIEVYFSTYRAFYGIPFVVGPCLELRLGFRSLDIAFPSHKTAYETDHKDYHNWEKDKQRDIGLLYREGWKIYRIDSKDIKALGYDKIGEQIYLHFMYVNNFIKEKKHFQHVFKNVLEQ